MVSTVVTLDYNWNMGMDRPFEGLGNGIPGDGNRECRAQKWERLRCEQRSTAGGVRGNSGKGQGGAPRLILC